MMDTGHLHTILDTTRKIVFCTTCRPPTRMATAAMASARSRPRHSGAAARDGIHRGWSFAVVSAACNTGSKVLSGARVRLTHPCCSSSCAARPTPATAAASTENHSLTWSMQPAHPTGTGSYPYPSTLSCSGPGSAGSLKSATAKSRATSAWVTSSAGTPSPR